MEKTRTDYKKSLKQVIFNDQFEMEDLEKEKQRILNKMLVIYKKTKSTSN